MTNGLFRRLLRGTVHLLGGLGAGLAIMMVFSAWKLSSGPISLAFLTPYIESTLATFHNSLRIRLDDTILTWAGWERTLDIRVLNVRVLGEDDAIVASVPELSLSLSAKALVKGMVAPKSIEMFRPRLKVERHRDGTLEVGFNTESPASQEFTQLMFSVLLAEPDPTHPMSFLSRVNIFDADIQVYDQRLESTWSAPNAQVQLWRTASGIKGDVTMDVLVGGTKANVSVLGTYLANEGRFDFGVDFNAVTPAAFAVFSPKLSMLAGMELPFQGTLTFSMLSDGSVESFGFDVGASKGALSIPIKTAQSMGLLSLAQRVEVAGVEFRGRYEGSNEKVEINSLNIDFGEDGKIYLPDPVKHEMPIKNLNARGRYLWNTSRLELDVLELDLNGPKASIALNMIGEEEGVSIGASGVVRNMEPDKLSRYWPRTLATDARTWIIDHISNGLVPEARAALQVRAKKNGDVEVLSLTGDMNIRGVTIDYLPPMPKAVNANATARFNKKKFDIFITGAEAEGLTTRKSIISFSGMDQVDQYADMDLFIKGPLKNALKLIESEPLGFSSAIGINPEHAEGNADAHVKLGFLLENTLTTDGIDISVAAKMHDVTIDNIILGQGIKDGQLDLKVSKLGLDMNGDVKLANIPANLQWRRNFGDDVPFRAQYQISSHIDNIRNLSDLGIDLSPLHGEFIEGGVGVDIGLSTQDDGTGKVQVRLDLNQVSLNVPALGWTKQIGSAGIAQVDLDIDGTRLTDIPRFSLAAGDLRINGSASYDENGTGISKVDINQFSLKRTNLAGVVIPGNDGGWTVSFHGPSFDLAPMFDDLFKGSPDEEDRFNLKLSLSAKVDKVWIGDKRYLKQITGTFNRANNRWRGISVDGALANGEHFLVNLTPSGRGKRDIIITADNAGDMLRTLDVYDTMIGGNLEVKATFDDTVRGHPLAGKVLITDYRLVEAPALARLVGILTLTGIADALQGDGLSFSEFKAPFVMKDGVIDLTDVKATGLSLGYTAKGRIYSHAEVFDIEGTVVPAYALNSVLGNIPLLGTLFTGTEEGGGIFAATYRMTGPMENPEVNVNPLSALAPGIFRNLFGILTDGPNSDLENAGAGKSQGKKLFGPTEGL
ncbi:MAG: hypothetical protein HN889_11470 [Rhodospirillaceae bacterium]|nr:hypothetical protein [Rhodospirillaceae bacterium]